MRALMLAVVLLCGTSFGADELPANVLAFKERCETAQAKAVVRAEKKYDDGKERLKKADSEKDKAKLLAALKKSLAEVKAAKAAPWHRGTRYGLSL